MSVVDQSNAELPGRLLQIDDAVTAQFQAVAGIVISHSGVGRAGTETKAHTKTIGVTQRYVPRAGTGPRPPCPSIVDLITQSRLEKIPEQLIHGLVIFRVVEVLEMDSPLVTVKVPAPELDRKSMAPTTDGIVAVEAKVCPAEAAVPSRVAASPGHVEATDGEAQAKALVETRASKGHKQGGIMAVTVDISDHNIADTAVEDVLSLHAQRNLATQVLHRGHELSYLREEHVGAEVSNEVSGAGTFGRQGSG